ncbi:hypothetical protein B0H16DRAFT_988248 [Mycena metata]|uniref:Uncharacterized protein n=1 Tax=Mycena metata TaxID=1033252 RepID=A0AAD7IJL7_9AGAR|nr:hypothetical protein B0H16DRAFT_988248 [Mycena metata]
MSQPSGASEQIPLDLQKQIMVSAYVFAGSTAVFIWDILNNLRSEYSLLSRHRLNAATVGYFASRIASFVYVLGFTIFASYPLQDCAAAYPAFSAFFPIGVSGTASLFFFRVRAIFHRELLPTIIFGCLWLVVLASSIATTVAGGAIGVGDPTVCVVARRHFPAAFFGFSGIAITRSSKHPGSKSRCCSAAPTCLPFQSRSSWTARCITLMAFVPVSPVYHGFLVIPNVTITSIMACRVYRNTKLGVARGRGDLTLPTLNTLAASGNTVPLSVVQFASQNTEMTGELHTQGPESDSTEHEESRTGIQLHLMSRDKKSSQPHDIP